MTSISGPVKTSSTSPNSSAASARTAAWRGSSRIAQNASQDSYHWTATPS